MRAHRSLSRRGVALILVIACLAVLTIVLGSLIKMNMGERRQSRAEERRLRAAWLAESGLERAWARLSLSSEYMGETWEIAAETLNGDRPAVVTIVVEPVPNSVDLRRIRAQADFPSTGTARSRQTRSLEIKIPASASEPPSGETR